MTVIPSPFPIPWSQFRRLMETADRQALDILLEEAGAAVAAGREVVLAHATPATGGSSAPSVLRTFRTCEDLEQLRADIERAIRIARDFA